MERHKVPNGKHPNANRTIYEHFALKCLFLNSFFLNLDEMFLIFAQNLNGLLNKRPSGTEPNLKTAKNYIELIWEALEENGRFARLTSPD